MASGVIDTYSHMFPPAWAPQGRMPQEMFDFDALIARQDEAGVALSIISDPHIWYGDLDPASIERTREYNDFAASITAGRPERAVVIGHDRRKPPIAEQPSNLGIDVALFLECVLVEATEQRHGDPDELPALDL